MLVPYRFTTIMYLFESNLIESNRDLSESNRGLGESFRLYLGSVFLCASRDTYLPFDK